MVNRGDYLFIEGTRDISNGDLREGFRKLLEKKVKGNMPRISMGQGKEQTVAKYLHSTDARLLCDLDNSSEYIESDLRKYGLEKKRETVFYMIQEMESWFLSQPTILDMFYKEDISKHIPKKPAETISEPDKELQNLTKNSRKGKYHKVRHGAQLLQMLDADRLYAESEEFKRLVNNLNK